MATSSSDIKDDTLWFTPQDRPRFLHVGCKNKHLRQVWPYQADEGVTCMVCREPMKLLTAEQVVKYKRWNRRCEHCKIGNHFLCTKVGCYECPHTHDMYLEHL